MMIKVAGVGLGLMLLVLAACGGDGDGKPAMSEQTAVARPADSTSGAAVAPLCSTTCAAIRALACPADSSKCESECARALADPCQQSYGDMLACLRDKGPAAYQCNALGRPTAKRDVCQPEQATWISCISGSAEP